MAAPPLTVTVPASSSESLPDALLNLSPLVTAARSAKAADRAKRRKDLLLDDEVSSGGDAARRAPCV